ncbi:type 1 fimbrial protein [Enterobacter roggenkampii]|nr:type 1 fimbrial protein [Enterobacter roggenkampii]
MKKLPVFNAMIMSTFFAITPAHADYFSNVNFHVMTYDLDDFTIPSAVGETSSNWHDSGSIKYEVTSSEGNHSYMELSVNGTLSGDGVSWVTNNPGIGIQFKVVPGMSGFTPSQTTTAPNYRLDLTGVTSGLWISTYYHLQYRLVRLLDKVPAGRITSVPTVTLNVHNLDGEGTAEMSGVIMAGISTQPTVGACSVSAPTEISLPTLYGNVLKNGAQLATASPSISLTNCPGAVDGISYNFSAVYGTHDAANGVMNTVSGEGYAQNVFIQVQNADGSPHIVNGPVPLNDYNGSGDYKIPDFKVAYYVDDAENVTAGNVKSAIELKMIYN